LTSHIQCRFLFFTSLADLTRDSARRQCSDNITRICPPNGARPASGGPLLCGLLPLEVLYA
jgi:hypothetical protein